MTPVVPRGSDPRSPTPTESEASEGNSPQPSSAPAAQTSSDASAFRFSIETSYLSSVSPGQAFRSGFITSFRPWTFLGFGLHLDTNFSTEVMGTLRAEGTVSLLPEFALSAALEAGVRGLIGQPYTSSTGEQYSASGTLFAIGIEASAQIRADTQFAFEIFARLMYSPPGNIAGDLIRPDSAMFPARGIEVSGPEFMAGLRLDFDLALGGSSHPDEVAETVGERASSSQLEEAGAAIQQLDSLLEQISEEPAVESHRTTDSHPTEPAVTPEDIATIRRELRILRETSDSLDVQIAASTRTLTDLNRGIDLGQDLHIRMDRIYDGISHRPPSLDLAQLQEFLNDTDSALRDMREFRLLVQSSSETFGDSFLSNLSVLQDALQAYQRRLPVTARSGELTRARLDPVVTQLAAIVTLFHDLRSRPVSTQPSNDQINLWRETLANIQTHLARISPQLSDAQRTQLHHELERLSQSFDSLIARLDEAEQLWTVARANFGHYQSFLAARRPELATAALRAMLSELQQAPESYRTLRRRNLENLKIMLVEYRERLSRLPAQRWQEASDSALAIIRWIDPDYQAPAQPTARHRAPLHPPATDHHEVPVHRSGHDAGHEPPPSFDFSSSGSGGGEDDE